jgi:hypothetical protein
MGCKLVVVSPLFASSTLTIKRKHMYMFSASSALLLLPVHRSAQVISKRSQAILDFVSAVYELAAALSLVA